jgi:hypothetical protein
MYATKMPGLTPLFAATAWFNPLPNHQTSQPVKRLNA